MFIDHVANIVDHHSLHKLSHPTNPLDSFQPSDADLLLLLSHSWQFQDLHDIPDNDATSDSNQRGE